MKAAVFSVFDSKIGSFAQPFFMINKGGALRAWLETAYDKSTNIGRYPADFTLFEIGTFDDETGVITMHEVKINLGTALEHITQAELKAQKTSIIGNDALDERVVHEQQQQEVNQ